MPSSRGTLPNMKAPVLHAVREPLVVEDVQLDEPKAGEVLVKMAASGVCHSCLHAADGSWAEPKLPMVLGDEGAGVVQPQAGGPYPSIEVGHTRLSRESGETLSAGSEPRLPSGVCQAALIIRRLRRRVEARPYPCLFSNFTLVTVPSTGPVDQGSVNPLTTAARSA
jgi:hypothetical protein